MTSFLRDFEKVNPQPEEPKMKNLDDEEKNIPNMTFQDMKDYFDGLKESLTSEMRKEMLEYINKKEVKDETNGNQEEEKKKEE